ncbi:hypothetical protein EON65_25910 [archaeon]|nr:MAG: hypothetical protein EON65_25910 [archaeon]
MVDRWLHDQSNPRKTTTPASRTRAGSTIFTTIILRFIPMETISVYRLCESYRQRCDEVGGGAPDAKSTSTKESPRFHVTGTGRIAFGTAAMDRPLFKAANDTSKAKPVPSGSRTGEEIETKFSTLELSPASTQQSTPMDVVKSSTTRQNNKRPLPTSNIANKAPVVPAKSTQPTQGVRQPANLVVGQSGKQAAMARLAALGEEWPEEEDLPGMSLPVSSSTSAGAYSKEAFDAAARIRKVQTAKRKK